jgi:hypothetical protein
MAKRKAKNIPGDTSKASVTVNAASSDQKKEQKIISSESETNIQENVQVPSVEKKAQEVVSSDEVTNAQENAKVAPVSIDAAAGDEQKEQSALANDKKRENRLLQQFATKWLKLVAVPINLIVPSIIAILFGFNPLPQSVPLLNIFKQHPFASLILCGILLFMTLSALIFSKRVELGVVGRISQSQIAQSNRLWIGLTGVSTISFLLCLTLLGMVWFRPSWCPNALCPPAQVATSSTGVHDSYLDLYPLAIQSPFFTLPGNPDQYSQNNLPENVGAVNADTKHASPYGIVVGVHSLQQGRFGMVIEQVALVIESVPPMPRPLNVWTRSPAVGYLTNFYQVTYRGEQKNSVLPAKFVSQLYGGIELAPGEADQLNIQVSSRVIADLRFRVQVTYRVSNESQLHVLLLPRVFEVMFSDNSNWHEYRLENGRFLP